MRTNAPRLRRHARRDISPLSRAGSAGLNLSPGPGPDLCRRGLALRPGLALRLGLGLAFLLCLIPAASASAAGQAQTAARLPAPEKIVASYVKALGGRKRVAAARQSTSEWDVTREGSAAGTARLRLKSPSSLRLDLLFADGESGEAANASTAWARERDGGLRTLTDAESLAARLQALLEASRFADFKKQKVLARTVAAEAVGGEQAYAVEFSNRAGARLRYWFGAQTGLMLQMSDEARGLRVRFGDWRARAGSALAAEPHRLELLRGSGPPLVLTLRESRHDVALADAAFDPPADAALDVPALLRELSSNQREVDRRIDDYTFTRKVTAREVNERGEVKKEKVAVYEVYPVTGVGWVHKLVEENGRPLSAERAAEESKRAAEALEKAARELDKRERQKAERAAKGREEKEDEDGIRLTISDFLNACEFISPRRELFRGRAAIVFDFRPRPDFKPRTRAESLASKLSGVVWVDPEDRHVVRLEARLVGDFKVSGWMGVSVKPGSAFVFEQTRLPDGVWLPRFSQVNASAKVLFVAGMQVNRIDEFGDYKRFSAKAGDDRLDAPEKPAPDKEPEH
ncbi:MAG TPA: hypothetical protein VEY09_16685 [Pyrinomonadaceae bacterium]|nr:hypothetical protein [Pyrinomonadaceae bacterium]